MAKQNTSSFPAPRIKPMIISGQKIPLAQFNAQFGAPNEGVAMAIRSGVQKIGNDPR